MEALLHVPANEGKHQTFRVSITDKLVPPACKPCMDYKPEGSDTAENK